jgi:hypothetical protein
MLKLKQYVVTAAAVLAAAGAMASNFRAADQIYLPIAGKVSTFKTDVFISNLSSDPVTVTFAVIKGDNASGTAINTNYTPVVLLANERREIIDFFATLNNETGTGQVVLNACKQGQDCSVLDVNGENVNFRNISVESRIYSTDAVTGNTVGQLFTGYPWYSYVSQNQANTNLDKVFITGLRQTGLTPGTFRSNIGVTNASQFSSTTIRVELFDKMGNAQGTKDIALGPLGQSQQNVKDMFPSYTGPTATGGWVRVSQISVSPTTDAGANGCPDGCPGFFTYGSVLDNGSNDPTTMEAQYTQPLNSIALLAIYPSAAGKGIHRAAKH